LSDGSKIFGNFDYLGSSQGNYLWAYTLSVNKLNGLGISTINISSGRPEDLLTRHLYYSNPSFSNSYAYGYNSGVSAGYDSGYGDGYSSGKSVGYESGYQAGFDASGAGGFSWLLSSVQSFLSVNFFGDFGVGTLLYVSLGISLVLIFIKMFAV
jgi:hypothetical protein